ncbi:GNAT family N-acetyltransferase [Alkalicoccus daliensis]|uniref:Protein N-acetyltransferase, RimJ/RimL family n=1 Tax=Alkalicoccus daliensis TaxID=745820 RepID=A0A1H0FYR8_9BACI|nr:GNAT family protein [Alkalicoccus daliensis]SDN99714.1 Protein N-acetyltransferase, RimJ/RimL family [Alkalicoccus daliensis]
MTPEFIIRKARISDAAQLAAIGSSITAEGYGLAAPGEITFPPKKYKKTIRHAGKDEENQLFLVAAAGEEVLGSLYFQRSYPLKYRHHGSFGMSLKQSARGLGIGSHLVEALIEWAEKEKTIEKITLEVLSENKAAIHLYKKYKFYEEGRLKNHVFFRKRYDDLILMARTM